MSSQNKLAMTLAFIITAFIVSLFFSACCHAAMLGIMTSTSTVSVGDKFTVDVYAVPQNDVSYVAGVQLEYNNAKLISWQSNGEFIKVKTDRFWNHTDWFISRTFSYPAGFKTTKKLGIATFEATKDGKVDVGIAHGFVLNGEGKNTFKF